MVTESSQETHLYLSIIRKYSEENSDAHLDPRTLFFSIHGIDGVIGYRKEGSTVIVFGDPVSEPSHKKTLVEAFSKQCESEGLFCIYVMCSPIFANECFPEITPVSIEVGEKMWLNPQKSPFDHPGVKGSLVRRKVRRALHEQCSVLEYLEDDPHIENEMKELARRWKESRRGFQTHISNIHLFDERPGKRWFCAYHKGILVGFVVLHAIESKNGWHLNHLTIDKAAPHGVSELLIIKVIDALAEEGCSFLSIGAIAKSHLGKIEGLTPVSSFFSRLLFQVARKLFRLENLREFWGKFEPESSSACLLFGKGAFTLSHLTALRKVLSK